MIAERTGFSHLQMRRTSAVMRLVVSFLWPFESMNIKLCQQRHSIPTASTFVVCSGCRASEWGALCLIINCHYIRFNVKRREKGDEWIKPEKTLFMQNQFSNVKPVVLVFNWRFRDFSIVIS